MTPQEEIVALKKRNADLEAVANGALHALQKFGDEYQERFFPLVEALKAAGYSP